MPSQPARYRRIIPEYVDSVIKTFKVPLDVEMNNRLETLLEEYCNNYTCSFVHSREGEKAEKQWRYVWLIVMLRVADSLMSMHARKLEKIVSEIVDICNTMIHVFTSEFRRWYGREPYSTEIQLFRNFIWFLLGRARIGDIASMLHVSVHTVRTYLYRVRRVFNEVLYIAVTRFGNYYIELSKIYATCRRINRLDVFYVPRGIFSSRFYDEASNGIFRTIWHVIANRCIVGSCDSWSIPTCFEYWYMITGWSLLQCCQRSNWQLLDICHDARYLRVERQYYPQCPIAENRLGLYVTFIDFDTYYEPVEPYSITLRQYRTLLDELWDMAKTVLHEKYEVEMEHKCMSM